jgi:hypothetical protein
MLYGHTDQRVAALALLNPWVSTEKSAAKTYLKDYYLKRLANPGFWRKAIKLELNLVESGLFFLNKVSKVLKSKKAEDHVKPVDLNSESGHAANVRPIPLNERIAEGLQKFRGNVLLVLTRLSQLAVLTTANPLILLRAE